MNATKPVRCQKCGSPIGYVTILGRGLTGIQQRLQNVKIVAICMKCAQNKQIPQFVNFGDILIDLVFYSGQLRHKPIFLQLFLSLLEFQLSCLQLSSRGILANRILVQAKKTLGKINLNTTFYSFLFFGKVQLALYEFFLCFSSSSTSSTE